MFARVSIYDSLCVEIEGCSITYFECIATFEVLCRPTSAKGKAHTCFDMHLRVYEAHISLNTS